MNGIIMQIDNTLKHKLVNACVDKSINTLNKSKLGFIDDNCKLSLFNMLVCCTDLEYIFNDLQLDNIQRLINNIK